MRVVQILSLAIGVASTALSPLSRLNLRRPSTLLPAVSPQPLSASNKPIQAFSISDLSSESFVGSNATGNRSLSFTFSDPNSDTSTTCSHSWTDSKDASTAPTSSYVPCDDTGDNERFQWEFVSYTDMQRFSIGFAHAYDDPIEYPPPYSWVSLFSTENSFKLTCTTDTQGLRHCVATQNPYRAVINQIAN